jgi:hypothetical protein
MGNSLRASANICPADTSASFVSYNFSSANHPTNWDSDSFPLHFTLLTIFNLAPPIIPLIS